METFILSITSFIGTNIDDMIINSFFFALAAGKKEVRSIVLGKYIGIGILVVISFVGSMGLKWISSEYLRYLGIVPIALGMKEWFGRNDEDHEKMDDLRMSDSGAANLLWRVMAVTIANGADNIGVYVPLFAGFKLNQYLICMLVFVVMTAIWCVLGYQVSRIPIYERGINKFKQFIVPVTYILLGVYILI